MKSFKDFMNEDAPTTSTGPGIDLAPTGKHVIRKLDRRSRYDINKMYEKSRGLKSLPQKDK